MNASNSIPSGIAVLGGGPAGTATAIGLVRLGYAVTLFNTPRRFAALEGVSGRVAQGLRQAGLDEALAALAPSSPRRVHWRGKESAINVEHLIHRPAFDAALLRDATRHGVAVREARVMGWRETADGRVAITLESETPPFFAAFVVEARGRAAPLDASRVRGPETVSLLQYWRPVNGTATGNVRSAVQSFADGWGWLAEGADGRRYLQLTFDAASADLPDKAHLAGFCRERLQGLELARDFTTDAKPEGSLHARACTPILAGGIAAGRSLRVGDAAVAGDPLSGNGIFLALSSALQAPAVINTILRHPARAALASDFHVQRLSGLFYRFARAGRDFYAEEDQWPQSPFWQIRQSWPDAEPLHREGRPEDVRIAQRPVLCDGEIIEAEVLVTPDRPLGVWKLDGIELAPALRLVREAGTAAEARRKLAEYAGTENGAAHLLAWFREGRYL
ncbi:MAG: FAD-dependent oxidoreductase [Azoarcus sp.]|jgi:flavin-dependent dehydrogenase|nr:FAD-dependent oxidoreductase [Azoarcus sp.]